MTTLDAHGLTSWNLRANYLTCYWPTRPLLKNNLVKLRSDNGGEYVNNKLTNFYTEQGIQQQHTVPNKPQQNGVAKWKNHTLK